MIAMNEPERPTPKRGSSFWSLPSTGLGRWSAWLLLVSVGLILLNNIAVMPYTEPRPSLEMVQRVFNLTVFLCVVSAGGLGLLAVVAKRERSWTLFLSVLLLILAMVLNLGPLVHV